MESDASYSLLQDAAPSLPLPSPPPRRLSPVLVVDACGELGWSVLSALRSSSPDCPITAHVSHPLNVRPSRLQWLQALGVTVHCAATDFQPLAHRERCALVRSHARVLLSASFAFRLLSTWGQYGPREWAEGAQEHRDEVLGWIAACHAEKAEHVLYVSTASPELFRPELAPHLPLESLHAEAEERLRADEGIRHWTILRPVSLMTLRVPSRHPWGREEPHIVFARFEPCVKQQLIAPEDVGRVAARVLQEGDRWFGRVLELAGPSRMSPAEEAEARTAVLQALGRRDEVAVCDPLMWTAWSALRKSPWWYRGPTCHWWLLLGAPLRRPVTQDVTLSLLPDGLLDYRQWLLGRLQQAEQQPVEPKKPRGAWDTVAHSLYYAVRPNKRPTFVTYEP